MSNLPRAVGYHNTAMRVFNHSIRLLNRVGVPPFIISEAKLLEAARKKTGLHDYGNADFLPRLRILLNSLNTEANLNPLGRLMQRQSISSVLRDRLYLQDLLKRHPEMLERKIADPIVIVGLARSGTTRLHRLMAADDQFLHLKAWESMKPVPYPESERVREAGQGIDPRQVEIEQGLKIVLAMSPQIASVHPLGANEVEEEIGMLMHDFSTQMFEVQSQVTSFAEHLMSNDQTSAYELMVTLLKVTAWYRNDPEDKPWILKSPQHMQDLDALMNVFPNAKIVCPHRDPIKAVGSACSMTWNSIVRDSDDVDPHWVGREWLAKTERMLRKNLVVRESFSAAQQHDVLYADITADWEKSVRRIYDFIGMEFTDRAKSAMQSWLDSNAQHKHGAHKYSLEDFGLTETQVEEQLGFYRARFNIPFEKRNPHAVA